MMARTERIPTREELVCLVCRKPGVALHHIRPRSTAPQSKDDPWNIVPICPVCHDLIHQKRMEARVRRGYFEWQGTKEKFWVRIPVKVNERHGCIDFGAGARAEAQGAADDESSAPSEAGSAAADRARAGGSERLPSTPVLGGADGLNRPPRQSAAASPASGGKVAKGQSKRVTASKSLVCGTGSHNRGASDAGYKAGEEREGPLSTGAGESSTAEAGEEVAVSATEVSRASTSAVPPSVLSPGETGAEARYKPAKDKPRLDTKLPGEGGAEQHMVPFLSLEFWCQRGMKLVSFGLSLKGIADEWRWAVGDWFNEGEAVLGEEAYAYTEPFRGETVQQYAWVARSVGRNTRVDTLPWTYHRSVAALPSPEQTEWLQEARDKNMTSRELHQAIHGKKPRVKRWSFEELESHLCHTCREVVSLMEKR